MGLTIDDFPTLTPDEIDNQSTPDKNNFSDDSMDQSPAVTPNHPLQTTFKRPRETTSDHFETLYSQIYNQLTKNEKHKRTKHNDSTLDSRLT